MAPTIKTFTSESHIKTIFRYLSVSCQTVEWNPRSILTCPPPKKKQRKSIIYDITIFSIFLMTTSISIPLLLLCNLAFELSTIFGRQLRIWRRYVRECSFSKQWPQFTPCLNVLFFWWFGDCRFNIREGLLRNIMLVIILGYTVISEFDSNKSYTLSSSVTWGCHQWAQEHHLY